MYRVERADTPKNPSAKQLSLLKFFKQAENINLLLHLLIFLAYENMYSLLFLIFDTQ
jgi:hypothetical protein